MEPIAIAQTYLREAYAGDLAAAGRRLADDVVLELGGRNALSGVHTGREAFFRAFARMMALSRGTYRLDRQECWAGTDDRALLVAAESAEHAGERVAFRRVIEYRVRDGVIRAISVYELDPQVVDEVFR